MMWQQLHISTSLEEHDAVHHLLEEYDALSITDQDAGQHDIFDHVDQPPERWPHMLVTALFEETTDLTPLLKKLKHQFKHADISCTSLQEKDWVMTTQAAHPPLFFGDQLCIHASWHTAAQDKINLLIDPGLAFGTGTHPTTQLCLEALIEHRPLSVIDYGCGSGILGLSALKLGAQKAAFVDIDPQALKTTQRHAENNQIDADCYTLFLADAFPQETQAPLVFANILAHPLLQLSSTLAHHTTPGGYIILSGLLHSQVNEIKEAYAPYFHFTPTRHKEEWQCLIGQRHS